MQGIAGGPDTPSRTEVVIYPPAALVVAIEGSPMSNTWPVGIQLVPLSIYSKARDWCASGVVSSNIDLSASNIVPAGPKLMSETGLE